MITKTTHVSIFVNDQDEALKFYTEQLGFKLHTDTTFGQNMRWLTVCSAEQPDFEFALMQANTDAQKALVGKQAPEVPVCCVSTNDCHKTVQELKSRGVTITSEPEEMPWGVSALFQDLYGNTFNIVEPK